MLKRKNKGFIQSLYVRARVRGKTFNITVKMALSNWNK